MQKVSSAEENGTPFETRCTEALALLRPYWIFQQCYISTNELLQVESVLQKKRLQAVFRSTSKKGMSGLMTHLDKITAEASAQFLKTYWDGLVQITQDVYGIDATEFAIKTLNAERKSN